MQKKSIQICGVVLLGMQSCAHIPEHDLATLTDTTGTSSIVEEALRNRNFSLGDGPLVSWWQDFDDPVLTEIIETAIQLSPTLQGAESRLKAAAEIAWEKRAALYPELDFVATNDWQHLSKLGFFRALAPGIPAVVNDVNIDLSFTYEFDFWGKNRDLFKAALGEAAARAAEKSQAELILTTSIGYSYVELQFLLKKKQILKEQVLNRKAIDTIREKRKQYALDTSLQHLSARSNTLDIEASIADLDSQIEQQIHRIKALAGLGQDAKIDFHLNPTHTLRVSLPECLSLDLIARRPDLVAQKARVEAAGKEINAAKTDFYPNINLQALIGLETIYWSKLLRSSNYSASITPAIHLPIFTAGRLRAHLMEKVEEFNSAVFSYNALILQAAEEVADSLTQIYFLQTEIAVRRQSLDVALRQEQLTQQRLNNALDDRIALLEAQYTVLQMELILETLEYGKQLANILLIRGLGGGYHGE